MFSQPIGYRIDESKLYPLPRMFDVKQRFVTDRVDDIGAAVRGELSRLPLPPLGGKRIALTAGSRGVANQAKILLGAIRFFREKGALPFIVPAMGSHGGATAEGQVDLLREYGIAEESMGVPILSAMDVECIGHTATGYPVYCDKNALAADYIFPIHRIKAHTGFKGPIESGLCKMLVIGLGKHKGALTIHSRGLSEFAELIPAAAEVFIAGGKVPGGLALVENALDETMIIEAIPPGKIIAREKELLVLAKNAMPRIHAEYADVLVVEEMGKNISGSGMDTNITGRAPGFPRQEGTCLFHRVVVLGLTPESHGNAAGIGFCDVATLDLVRNIDLAATYTNSLASCNGDSSRLPIVANTERDAVRIGMLTTPRIDPARARIIHLKNTMELTRIRMSEAFLGELREGMEILSEPRAWLYDEQGRLERLPTA